MHMDGKKREKLDLGRKNVLQREKYGKINGDESGESRHWEKGKILLWQ